MSDLPGKSIGRYHILEQVGKGGMAVVYKAFDMHLEREVAVKIIRKDAFPAETHERILKRFEREAKTLAKLSHSSIIKVHDYGEVDGAPFLVMELFEGGILKDYLGQPMSVGQAVSLLLPVARGLAYAHKQGILHRDVKPSNILINQQSGEVVLTDFGIAKLLEDQGGHTLTGTGVGVGTPEYMAPEQGLGKKIDGRADVYALGIVLYELLTGRKPFQAETPLAVLYKQMNDPLPRPKEMAADLSPEVEQVLLKALAKDPQNRYENMGNFVKALERLVNQLPDIPVKELNNPFMSQNPEEETRGDLNGKITKLNVDDNKRSGKQKSAPVRPTWGLGIGIISIMVLIFLGFFWSTRDNHSGIAFSPSETPAQTPSITKIDTQEILSIEIDIITPQFESSNTPTQMVVITYPLDIPLYDDFEEGIDQNWYIASWSSLSEHKIDLVDGKLVFEASGQGNEYTAIYYYLNQVYPIKKFYILLSTYQINSQGVFSIILRDEENSLYSFGLTKDYVFFNGKKSGYNNLLLNTKNDEIWLGIELENGKLKCYYYEDFVYETTFPSNIVKDNIGLQLGAYGNAGSIQIEVEEVRIKLFQ